MKNKRICLKLLPAACLLLLAGCAIGPDYVKPQMDIPAAFKEDGRWKTAQPADLAPRDGWWQVFGDQQLNRLVLQLNQQSPAIAQAEAQYRQARELLNQAEASLFPTINATASANRGVSTAGNPVSKQYNAGLSASWEIDLWGAVRRAVEAGEAKEAASSAQLAAIRLSTQAQLVSAYLQLVVADRQLVSLRESEAALAESLRLTKNQYAAGIVSDASVQLAESQLKTAQAATIDKALSRAQFEHAVAASLGQAPAGFTLDVSQALPHLPQVAAGVASSLLERRPDIAAAERNVAQLNAQIGLAQTAYFPSLTLGASGSYRGSSISDWISAPNRIWSIGPQLAATIFDAGARKAQTAQAVAAYDAGVAAYRQTVLTALQGVEDTIAAQGALKQEESLQLAALEAAQKSEKITLNQYAAGTVSYLNVLSAQTTRIAAENSLWTVRNRQYVNSVSLIVGLGGSW